MRIHKAVLKISIVGFITLLIFFWVQILFAQHNPGMHDALQELLNEEQQAEIKTLVAEMREADSDREGIRDAVHAKLDEWGIEMPDSPDGKGRPGIHGPLRELLNEEQQAEIKALVAEMREADSDRKEIHDAVHAKLDEWGIEMPEPPDGKGGPGIHGPLRELLSEEQQAEIKALVAEMREADSDRKEIHDAVHAKLDEWGIEMPEPPDGKGGPGMHGALQELLSEEQQAEIKALVAEMREADSDRKEIRDAVHAKLDEWGIEMPEQPDGDFRETMQQLDKEQRQQVHSLIKEMRKQGSTQKEIHQAVQNLIESFGIVLPDKDQDSDIDQNKNVYGDAIVSASNFPNPFNPETRITFTLGKAGMVNVRVFNVSGQLVKTLINDYRIEGTHQIQWNGTLENGQPAPSGMYFFQIKTNGETFTERMTLMK